MEEWIIVKTAFVTGADRGLGLALAEELLKQNYRVFAGHLEHEPAGLEAVKSSYGEQIITLRLDISSSDNVAEAFEQVGLATASLTC
jgi:NAD(P)-dependent dehydrogenase (short-subunit alcohol dehydrogenase family)